LPRLCSSMLARATACAHRALGGATGAWGCVGVGRVGFTAASAVRLPTGCSTHSVCEQMGVATTAAMSLRRAHGAVRIPVVAWPAQPSQACGAASVGTALGRALGARPDVTMLDAFGMRGQIRTATFGAHSLPLPNPTHGLPFGHVSHFPSQPPRTVCPLATSATSPPKPHARFALWPRQPLPQIAFFLFFLF
jgi:hypothetical protein